MAPADTTTQELTRMHTQLGEVFGRVAREAIAELPRSERPSLIGLAGQTICHLPADRGGRTATLQLGSPAHVAAITGLPVVADFRQSDVAAGGQGAPLVPWTDWVLFHDAKRSRAIQNIGGIGNVTWVPAGGGPHCVVAFDTGPGNMVIDGLMRRITGGRSEMDCNGRTAARGNPIEPVVERWLSHPFFRQRPPRTTGREMFGDPFIEAELPALRAGSSSHADWIATATAFTARSIAESYDRFIDHAARQSLGVKMTGRSVRSGRLWTVEPAKPSTQVILCGGGSKNKTLRAMLATILAPAEVLTIDDFGIPSEAKEAVSFAMLAAARMDQTCANLPQSTGAHRACVMGCLYC